MKNIIFLAVQGAGKGTFAKKLKEKYGYAHISTGDILRERAAVGDELGNQIKNMIDNGIFVPNDIIYEAIEYKITQPDCEKGYILDGFPRNIEQAEGYDKILEKLGKELGVVVNLTIPNELLKQRIIGRRICKDCGAIYNIYNKAYLLLKPPFLSEKESIEDIINSINTIHNIVDIISINPCNIQKNTFVEKL